MGSFPFVVSTRNAHACRRVRQLLAKRHHRRRRVNDFVTGRLRQEISSPPASEMTSANVILSLIFLSYPAIGATPPDCLGLNLQSCRSSATIPASNDLRFQRLVRITLLQNRPEQFEGNHPCLRSASAR